jgi:hypothetical protein
MGMPKCWKRFAFDLRRIDQSMPDVDIVYKITPGYGIPYMNMHTLLLTWNAILSGAFESPTDDIALGRRSKARHEAATDFHNASVQGQSSRDKGHDA